MQAIETDNKAHRNPAITPPELQVSVCESMCILCVQPHTQNAELGLRG